MSTASEVYAFKSSSGVTNYVLSYLTLEILAYRRPVMGDRPMGNFIEDLSRETVQWKLFIRWPWIVRHSFKGSGE